MTSKYRQKVHLKQCNSTLKLNVASDAALAPIEFEHFVRFYRRASRIEPLRAQYAPEV
jgi:hypothetical protein